MPEDILVVEYEPRYTERVRQALSGHAFQPVFARDGEEALRALENTQPKLIVVSSMLPKMTSTDLIHKIRVKGGEQAPPILLTITGYNGKSPKTDASKVGASDLLPKPYSPSEFLGKVNQMLGLEAPDAQAIWSPAEISAELSRPAGGEAEVPAVPEPSPTVAPSDTVKPKQKVNAMGDIDQMLAQTLAGVRLPTLKKGTDPGAKPARPKASALPDLDKLLEDTRSGLEKKLKSKETLPAPPAPPPSTETRPHMAAKWMNPVVPPVEPTTTEHDRAEEETPDGIRFGQYVLTERIATGGMAEVWKAKMRGVEGFQKIVAIKKILPHLSDNAEFVDMFIDEAKLAAQLNHSNVIHIYDLGKIANSYYIAMEFIEGHDLKSILRRATERTQPLPIELALFIVSKIASALDYAHRKRDFDDNELELVHRDVSPQNVLISYEGDIKLCDFGIAKAASKASHTLAGALKGKLQYMSPEQAWGRKIDRRSDIFALGVVLFELLTGRKLFLGENELSILEVVRQAKIVAPSTINEEVTPEIDAIVLRALQRDPENRYQTAGEMAKDLDAIVYNFWPTPTSADLAIYMHHLYTRDVPVSEPAPAQPEIPAPAVVMPPFEASAAAAPAEEEEGADGEVSFPILVPPPPAVSEAEEAVPAVAVAHVEPPADRRRIPAMALVAGAILVAGAASGGYFYWRGRSSADKPVAAASPTAAPASARTAQNNTTPVTSVPTSTATLPQATVDQAAVIVPAGALGASDEARINEEVRRRLEAERQRLQTLAAQQPGAAQRPNQPVATDTVSQVMVAPISSSASTATTQTFVEPPPTPVPTPEPVVVQATPVPAPAATPAVVAQSSPPRPAVREGDLVDAATEGLIPPQLIKQYKPPYPPAAKMQKVQGLVVVQALISETGKVLETRVLRGVSQSVGINEAAIEAVRRSTFKPAVKDGVRVKAYKNITIPFKL